MPGSRLPRTSHCSCRLVNTTHLVCCPRRRCWLWGAGRIAGQHTFVRQHSSPSTSMIIASMMHPIGDCRQERAYEMIQLALMSRRDYAQWHSYELHLATRRLGWGISEKSVSTSASPASAALQTAFLTSIYGSAAAA